MSLQPERFRAPFITKAAAWAAADKFRAQHWPHGTIPVEVEKLLWPVGLRLEPIPSLKTSGDVDALLSGDLARILVDAQEYMDDKMQNRLRFSIAHELGHFVLHADVFRKINYASVEEWIDFIQRVPDEQYGYIEFQAYEFAGRLLVPLEQLQPRFEKAFRAGQRAGFTKWDSSGDAAREYIASNIARDFGVSSEVIEKRIRREGLITTGRPRT